MADRHAGPGAEQRRFSQLAVRLLGVEPLAVRRTSSPDAWFVDLPGDRGAVVKTPGWLNRPGSPLVEAWAYEECARHGIRVPRVLALSEEPECLIVERLRGEPLPGTSPLSTADRAVWARAGEDLRLLHEIPLLGFGALDIGGDAARGTTPREATPRGTAPRGTASTWCPFAEFARAKGIPWLVDAGYLSAAAGDRLVRRFDEASPVFSQVTAGRFLHGDLGTGHIFRSSDASYEGIIDFGQSQAGDPRWDLGRVRLWDGDEALDALLPGYGADVVTRDDREFLLPLYLFSFVAHHAVGHNRPDYIQTLLDRSGFRALL